MKGKGLNLVVGEIEKKILRVRGVDVVLDSDVARFYGVETREVNQAVRNNLEKFPEGYILELGEEEEMILRSKFLITKSHMSRAVPKVFTEKGMYMLATILKGERAVRTTLAIIEAFARLREVGRNMVELAEVADSGVDGKRREKIVEKASVAVADLLGESMSVVGKETTIEFNLLAVKMKHTIRREKGKEKA